MTGVIDGASRLLPIRSQAADEAVALGGGDIGVLAAFRTQELRRRGLLRHLSFRANPRLASLREASIDTVFSSSRPWLAIPERRQLRQPVVLR